MEAAPNQTTFNTQHVAPKPINPQMADATPPPYYSTSTRRSSLASMAASQGITPAVGPAHIYRRTVNNDPRAYHLPLVATAVLNNDQPEDDMPSPMSPLTFRINTSVNVSKNNNIIVINESPSNNANAIADAMIRAIHETSAGGCGIPMVDGDGNPRPVQIEVDASTSVDGFSNVIGNQKMAEEALRQREAARAEYVKHLDPIRTSDSASKRAHSQLS